MPKLTLNHKEYTDLRTMLESEYGKYNTVEIHKSKQVKVVGLSFSSITQGAGAYLTVAGAVVVNDLDVRRRTVSFSFPVEAEGK